MNNVWMSGVKRKSPRAEEFLPEKIGRKDNMSHKSYRIVVGTDFSDTAHVALEKAFELAAKEDKAEVHVVNAVQHLGEFVQMDLPEVPAYRLPLDEAQEKLEAYVGSRLSAWQDASDKSFSRCVTYLSTDYPAQAVVQLANDLEADLIVVGTHGRQGFRRFLLGSVAEGVVRTAHCPVLVVRPKDQSEKVPEIEPPCPACVEVRNATGGEQLWCERHMEKHGPRHIYHYEDRNTRESNVSSFPGMNR